MSPHETTTMNHRSVCSLALAAFAYSVGGGSPAQQPAPTHDDVAAVEDFLFVQNSASGSFDGERLSLHSVAPTIFFSDRPYRLFGHVNMGAFVEAWGRGPNSFAEDPPNAILSLLGEEHVDSFMVALSDPRADEGGVSYKIDVEEGTIPATFGGSSLFIDNEAWAAVGGLVAGRALTRRRDAREASAYEMGKASATTAQTPSYYYNASVPTAPPPPGAPPPPPAPATPPSVEALLDQAVAEMNTYASTATDQNKQYIAKLVETVKAISADYSKVAK